MNEGKPLATIGAETILERLRAGEKPVAIAADLKVSHVALYQFLIRNAPEEWASLSASRSLTKIEEAEDELGDAKLSPDGVSVARSREKARLAQWNLERMAPRMYGDTKNQGNGVNIQVVIQRDGSADANIIEVERDPGK